MTQYNESLQDPREYELSAPRPGDEDAGRVAYLYRSTRMRRGQASSEVSALAFAAKRTVDVVVSGTLLLLISPLLLAIGLAVRLTSSGPALFVQQRVGREGQPFRLLKFRTMVHEAERATGPVWAQTRDPRCTRLGRVLRRTSLDELPQLWNVFVGHMSLVGPRPERPVFAEQFGREYPDYLLRLEVQAGMTGWAQINGWRGNTSVDQRLRHDLQYIRCWTPLLDLRILYRTALGGFLNPHP